LLALLPLVIAHSALELPLTSAPNALKSPLSALIPYNPLSQLAPFPTACLIPDDDLDDRND